MKIGKILYKTSKNATALYKQLSCEGDIETLHQYRVSLRKLNALNIYYIEKIDKQTYKKLSKLLNNLLKPTAKLRDLDIFLLDSVKLNCSKTCKDDLKYALLDLRQTTCKTFKKQIFSSKYINDLKALSNIINKKNILEIKISKSDTKNIILRFSKELFEQLYQINEHSSLKELHKLRIKFKTFRYALIACKKCGDISKFTTLLKELQDMFGKIQDNNIRVKIVSAIDKKLSTKQKQTLNQELVSNLHDAKAKLFEYAKKIKADAMISGKI